MRNVVIYYMCQTNRIFDVWGYFCLFEGANYTFFSRAQSFEFGKIANSTDCVCEYIPISTRFVWRQLEFAFSVR